MPPRSRTPGRTAQPRSTPRTDPPTADKQALIEEASEPCGQDVDVPAVGRLRVPPTEHLAWYAGVVLLAALEVVDWPVALLIGAGKLLADNRASRSLQSLGDAIQQVL